MSSGTFEPGLITQSPDKAESTFSTGSNRLYCPSSLRLVVKIGILKIEPCAICVYKLTASTLIAITPATDVRFSSSR